MNIQNIKNLLVTYFIENWKRDLWQFGVLAGVAFFAEVLSGTGRPEVFAAVVMMLYYSARSFVELSSRTHCMHTLLVPGTATEKVSAKMFLSCIYYVAGCFISILVGEVIGYGLRLWLPLFEVTEFVPFFSDSFNTIDPFIALYFSMSLLFFTSIYFKGKNILKTLGILFVLAVFFALLMLGVAWLNYALLVPDGMKIKEFVWHGDFSLTLSDFVTSCISYILTIGGTLYFYGLSFLRFKETEA